MQELGEPAVFCMPEPCSSIVSDVLAASVMRAFADYRKVSELRNTENC